MKIWAIIRNQNTFVDQFVCKSEHWWYKVMKVTSNLWNKNIRIILHNDIIYNFWSILNPGLFCFMDLVVHRDYIWTSDLEQHLLLFVETRGNRRHSCNWLSLNTGNDSKLGSCAYATASLACHPWCPITKAKWKNRYWIRHIEVCATATGFVGIQTYTYICFPQVMAMEAETQRGHNTDDWQWKSKTSVFLTEFRVLSPAPYNLLTLTEKLFPFVTLWHRVFG
jgi:hypothetical protein